MNTRLSIIGLGNMGKNHLRVLSMLEGATVTKIFDTNEAELQLLSKQYGVPYTLDVEEAIDDTDAVILVTPTSTHFDYFKLCAGKVKNILVEKPLAETYAQALEIKKLADKNGMFLQCGFIERFNPAVAELKKILQSKKVINIDFFRTNRLSARVTDVDVVLDLMIHDIDLALYLNGPVESIGAFGSKENGSIAFSSALLKHSNGSASRLIASRMTEKKMRTIQVTATDSYIDVDLLRRDLFVHRQSSVSRDTESAYEISSTIQQVEVKPREALVEELKAFIDGCNGDFSTEIPCVNEGSEAQRICHLILEKINNG
jgi:predicted dehydrogenase